MQELMFELGQKKGLNLFLFDMCIRYGWVLDIACTFFVFLSFSSYFLILLNLRLFHCISVFFYLYLYLRLYMFVIFYSSYNREGIYREGSWLHLRDQAWTGTGQKWEWSLLRLESLCTSAIFKPLRGLCSEFLIQSNFPAWSLTS